MVGQHGQASLVGAEGALLVGLGMTFADNGRKTTFP